MSERIVEVKAIFEERGARKLRFGSGLLIGGRTVLTAAHLLTGAQAVVIRMSDKRELTAVVDPAWVGDPRYCDLALLEVAGIADSLDFLSVAVIDRHGSSTAFVENCTSIGFPAFAEEPDERGVLVRKSAQVCGRIAPLSRLDDGLVSLEVSARPRELAAAGQTLNDSPWAGMSGAAVLADDRIVGVVCEHAPRHGSSNITVTPLNLLSDPDRVAGDWWRRLGVADPAGLVKLPVQLGPNVGNAPHRLRFNVGYVDQYFAGRETELASLKRALTTEKQVVVTQVMAGLGGVGKTQLAARCASDLASEFDIVAWIRAETSPIADLATLATELKLSPLRDGATAEQRAEQVVRWLSVCEESWLLVFDNVTTEASVRPWLPTTGKGRILVTSRNRSLDTLGPVVSVDVFDNETGTNYLIKRALRDERAGAAELSHALGGLPLALAHAGAYCQTGTSFAEYQAMLHGLPARELFDQDPEAFAVNTVATTWQVSIDAAVKRAPLAGQVLTFASYLAPDAIPAALFETLLADSTDLLERKQLRDALAALHRLSLLDLSDGTVNVHRLVQKVVRDDAEATSDQVPSESALAALVRALPHDPSLPTWWPQYEALLPHILTITETTAVERHPEEACRLLRSACLFLLHADPGLRSLAVAQRQLDLAERFLDSEHATALTARVHLAASYWSAGRIQEAIDLQRRVLADQERLLGTEHPDSLVSRANLATSYMSAGHIQEAIDLQERGLADHERLLGTEHPNTLSSRANLANTYRSAGFIQEAIDLEERVLADRERLLGPEHPQTLTSRGNLATSYWSAGRIDEAIDLQEQVAKVRARLLGPQHPHTLSGRASLAASYLSAGRTQEAIDLHERVATDRESVLGPEHPDTLITWVGLASAYRSAGRIQEAIDLHERAVADHDRLLGPQHLNTVNGRANLAASYLSAGRTQEAIDLHERAVTDYELLLGPQHPDTLTGRANLAASYLSAGRTEEAIDLQERVAAHRESALGLEHPDTLVGRANLATSYWTAGRIQEAINLQERVLAENERVLGANHADTLASRANLASSYWSGGRTQEAIDLQERVLADHERILGPEHSVTRALARILDEFRGGDPIP